MDGEPHSCVPLVHIISFALTHQEFVIVVWTTFPEVFVNHEPVMLTIYLPTRYAHFRQFQSPHTHLHSLEINLTGSFEFEAFRLTRTTRRPRSRFLFKVKLWLFQAFSACCHYFIFPMTSTTTVKRNGHEVPSAKCRRAFFAFDDSSSVLPFPSSGRLRPWRYRPITLNSPTSWRFPLISDLSRECS